MSCFPFIAAGREFEVINLRLALPLLLSPFSFPPRYDTLFVHACKKGSDLINKPRLGDPQSMFTHTHQGMITYVF